MFKEFLDEKLNKTYVNDRTGEESHRRVVNGKYAKMNKAYEAAAPVRGIFSKLLHFNFRTIDSVDVVNIFIAILAMGVIDYEVTTVMNIPALKDVYQLPFVTVGFIQNLLFTAIAAIVVGNVFYGIYKRGTSDYANREESYSEVHPRVLVTVLLLTAVFAIVKIFL